MEIKAVLFDMDGVIVDTEPLHRKAYFKMFEDNGLSVSEELYQSFTGQSTKSVCKQLKERFKTEESVERLMQEKRTYFKEFFDNDPDFNLLPGVLELIQHYYSRDIKLVLASSASMNTITWVFDRFELNPYFVGKISGADLKASKPHPEIFIKAAEIAKTARENCIVIEDSTSGIRAAYDAGIYCIAYKSPHSKNQKYDLANKVISDFTEAKLEKI